MLPCSAQHGEHISVAGDVTLRCPDVEARSEDGEATYGNITRTFDLVPTAGSQSEEVTAARSVVLPSQIECNHPPRTKFEGTETFVTCLWLADPSISCTFKVKRGAIARVLLQ